MRRRKHRCADCNWTEDVEERRKFDWITCADCARRNEESSQMEDDEMAERDRAALAPEPPRV